MMKNEQSIRQKRWFPEFMKRFAPPGMDTDRQINGYLTGLFLMLLFSVDYFVRYQNAWRGLFYWPEEGEKILIPGAVMPDFSEMLGESLRGFFLYCLILLAAVVWNYLYYYQGSRSIYLMKRLPNPMERHKRAWVLPLLAVGLTLAAAFVVLVLYFEFYMIVTPKQCIAPGQWHKIWR
ncbi:MAG: hypothetical protein J6A77_06050 [Lachnospiraceae bacterium]|nr:hypothetical protein [Lachnospiraceae bacterium]